MKALVIGAGSIGERHLQNLTSMGLAAAVVEPIATRREALSNRLGIPAFASLDEGLDWPADFAVIASPTHLHLQHALKVVRHGLDVFVEKPLSNVRSGLPELAELAEKRNVVSLVGCNMRFHPGPGKIKELLQHNCLGRILFARVHVGSYLPGWRPGTDYRENYAAKKETGGGCILDCIHEIDLARWYLGEVEQVSCMAGHLSSLEIDTEDVVAMMFRHVSGAISEIHLDYVQRSYERGCQIVGESGSVFWDFNRPEVRWFDGMAGHWVSFALPESWKINQMYMDEMQHFLDCVKGRRRTTLDISEAVELMEVVFSAKDSAAHWRSYFDSQGRSSMNLAVIQARMGSTRFPGKTLADVCGRPMLSRVVERVRKAKLIDRTVVATTACACDDAIASACQEMDVACYRGNAEDVLDRFYWAAKAHSADAVVRVTADCPLIDPEVIDKVVERFQEGDCDYVSNTLRYSYPDGLDTEVFSFRALEEAWQQATLVSEREHVTPYLRKAIFRTANVECESTVPLQRQRWTVDYPSDLDFVRKIYSEFTGNGSFGFRDVVRLLERKPAIAAVRGKIICNEGYYRGLCREAVAGSAPKLPITQSLAWLARSQKVIPGGAQTFSKAHTQYVQGVAPIFLARGKGARVWDVDGNEYIDYVQGLLPNILGYADEEVNRAVAEQIAEGHSFSLAHPIEVELAERLVEIIPCAEMVRFGKNGSDVTSGAVRAARAHTGRERIACCGYHGWQDWYIGSTSRHLGVPAAVRGLTHSFRYNDLASLEAVLTTYNGEFAAVIMEPFNFQEPAPGFLQGVKDLAHNHGALLIFDEICSGFHFGLGGAQKLFGVIPDLACFGKAMGNGFPISCVVGGADVMRTMEKIFFSSTFAGETSAMAAAMKVFDVLENTDALTRIEASGRVLQDGTNVLAKEAGLEKRLECVGRPQWSLLKFYESDGADSLLLKNLFQQEAIKRGILLLATHNLTAAHDSAIIDRTLEIYAAVIKTLAGWLQDASPAQFLEGTMSQPIFRVR